MFLIVDIGWCDQCGIRDVQEFGGNKNHKKERDIPIVMNFAKMSLFWLKKLYFVVEIGEESEQSEGGESETFVSTQRNVAPKIWG